MTDAGITGNITDTTSWLFRDSACLEEIVGLPVFDSGRAVEIASIGCSTGEEVYSLMAMLQVANKRFTIKGYDISTQHLKRAKDGSYHTSRYSEENTATCVDLKPYLGKFGFDENDETLYLTDRTGLKGFERADIVTAPLTAPVDIILCRNVLFHYQGKNRELESALKNIDASLNQGGVLVLDTRSAVVLETTGYLQRLYNMGYTSLGRNNKILMKQEVATEKYLLTSGDLNNL